MPRKPWAALALVGLLTPPAAALAWLLLQPPLPLAAAERLFQAAGFHLLAPVRPPHPRIAVIGITEATLAGFPYRSPVDRGFLASLIGQLTEAGVAAIGLDLLLDRATEPAKDAALREAMQRAGVPLIAISLAPETPLPPAQQAVLGQFLDGLRHGTANLARERFDDTVRTHLPWHPITGAPSFPAALAGALGVAVPRTPFAIAWRRSATGGVAPAYPAEAVALLPPDWLRGRVALIGSMVAGTDEHRSLVSAFGGPGFGIEIHAQVLAQLLDGRVVAGGAWREALALLGLAAAGAMAGALLAGRAALLALAGLGFGWLGLALAGIAAGAAPWPALGPVLAALLAGGGARAWQGREERRDRALLHQLFSRFVSAPVAEAMLRERETFLAGGRPKPQELVATVLFSDVAGFTAICESLPPAPLIAWLDRYLDAMVGIVMAHGGVVLRFVGDGILVVFGAPLPRRTEAGIAADARAAARCALAMEEAMAGLNAGWRAAGLPEAGLRIGIHTGPLVAGGLGHGARMEFTLLGDTANVGARLEQAGKQHGDGPCTIMVGEPTWLLLGGEFPGRCVGSLPLRNRRAAMPAWRIDRGALRGESAAAG